MRPLRSALRIVVGMLGFWAGLGALLLLPRITPYDLVSCSYSDGGRTCVGNVNPAYWALLFTSVGCLVLFFDGLFGRGFIFRPLFITGLLPIGFGLVGIVFGYLGSQWCASQTFLISCLAYHPEFYAIPMLLGGGLIGLNGYWWHRGLHDRVGLT